MNNSAMKKKKDGLPRRQEAPRNDEFLNPSLRAQRGNPSYFRRNKLSYRVDQWRIRPTEL
jgi:hypothetical protein